MAFANNADFPNDGVSDEDVNNCCEAIIFERISSQIWDIKNMLLGLSEMAMVSIIYEVLVKLAAVFTRIEECPSAQMVFNPEIFSILQEVFTIIRNYSEYLKKNFVNF